MLLAFRRGTLHLDAAEAWRGLERCLPMQRGADTTDLVAPALAYPAVRHALLRLGLPFRDAVTDGRTADAFPRRLPDLDLYQEALLGAWERRGCRGVATVTSDAAARHLVTATLLRRRAPALLLCLREESVRGWAADLLGSHVAPIALLSARTRDALVTVGTFARASCFLATHGDRFGVLVVDDADALGGALSARFLEHATAPARLGLAHRPTGARLAAALEPLLGPPLAPLGGRAGPGRARRA